jgi:hypothetical protein
MRHARNKKVASWLGFFSILLSVVPIVYIFHADRFPNLAQTEAVVIIGGVGGSFLAALSAGIIGSRWWLLAILAAAIDIVCLWGFSP